MRFPITEKFKSVQGEGLYTGVPMAFIRFIGCSVGKETCTACDTDFDKAYPHMGGGMFNENELVQWAFPYDYILLTGGEPLDRDLRPIIDAALHEGMYVNIETSGTVHPHWLLQYTEDQLHICVSPKPKWLPSMIARANEVKVIVGGLGEGRGWPDVEQAVAWADQGRTVFLQPRNAKSNIDDLAMQEAIQWVQENPKLRLSTQLHKWLMVR